VGEHAHAGLEHRPRQGEVERVDHAVVGVVAERVGEARQEPEADDPPQARDVGVAGEEGVGAGGGQLRLPGDDLGDVADRRGDPVGGIGFGRVVGRRLGLEPAAEHLGDEVVLRREVRVGGGGGDPGAPGDVAHRQAVVSGVAHLVDRRRGQPLDRVGLTLAQVPPHRFPRSDAGSADGASGHGSGH